MGLPHEKAIDLECEVWKTFTECGNGLYSISNYGRVKNNKRNVIVHPSVNIRGTCCFTTCIKGERKQHSVARAVYTLFNGDIPDGYKVYHRNGINTDNSSVNLIISKDHAKQQRKVMERSARSVVQIDENGEIVQFFKSARECAERQHMAVETIRMRCRGAMKKAFCCDGFEYAWDDERSIKKALKRIEEDKKYKQTH